MIEGTRVRCIKIYDGIDLIGKKGTILSKESGYLSVQFDERFNAGHDGSLEKKGRQGHCWNFPENTAGEYLVSEDLTSEDIFTISSADDTNREEQKMSTINSIKTIYQVNGVDITTLTSEQKVFLISDTEKKIATLKEIKTKSKMIDKEISKLETFLADAVTLFDKE